MIEGAESVEAGARLDCDLCIVGGGAAGIAVALQFLRGPGRVILLESGGRAPDAAVQALYEGEVADPALHSPTDTYRQRRFGGSTTIWGGRCAPLDLVDFEHRDWMPNSGWPIGPAELAPFYPAANALLEAGEYDYDARTAVPGGMRPMIAGFRPRDFTEDGIERFSCPTDLGARYGHRLAASEAVRVILGANVTKVVTDPDGGRVEHLEVRTMAGGAFTVHPRRLVLALGGLEAPRLLLASRRTQANGVGNGRDLVGRYYMSHIAGTYGALRLAVPRDRVNHGYEVAEDGTYCRRRLTLTPEAQAREGIGNALVRLHFPRIPDPRHRSGVLSALYLARPLLSYEYRKRLAEEGGGGTLAHLRNVALDPFSAVRFAWTMAWKRVLAVRKFPSVVVNPPGNLFSLDYHGEQEPNPSSRVTLGDGVDRFGMPRLRVDWRHTERDIRTAEVTFRLLREEFARWGRGWLDYEPSEVGRHMLREGAYGGHHIGTLRMGETPATGVVDADCRVHGVINLYVAGSAVFPTSSQANPTLTLVALALRLAAHLRAAERPVEVGAGTAVRD